ncbi:hypothetical protein [Algibacter sp. 2305UL17-15]|uniref:hypothetical protein n=1 Tax=Algibacter sp. 2305UL17-15 TaxID=3231268 RepID=UPI00345B2F16
MITRKKIIFYFVGLLALMISIQSCDEEELRKEQTSQRFVSSSEQDFNNTVEIDDVITFADVSPGVVSREWSVDEGVAILKPGNENGITSSKKVVNAFFKKVGDYEVRLNQVFETEAFIGSRLAGKVLDTTIVVHVIGGINSTLSARKVNADGSLGDWLNMANGAQNEVQAGSTVRYYVESTGEPKTYRWYFDGGDPTMSTQFVDEIDVKYKKLGVYDFSFQAGRSRPKGSFEETFEDLLDIIPSTEPLFLDGVIATPEGTLELNFSREIEASSIDINDFTVSITNGGSPVANNIASITTKPDAANILVLTLDGDRVYNDDTITVSYTQGSLITTDAKLADDYLDRPVVFIGENILESAAATYDPGLENSTSDNWPYGGWGAPWDGYNRNATFISTEQSYEGDKSIKLVMQPNGGAIFSYAGGGFPLEDGKAYEIGLWVYLDVIGPTNPGGLQPDLRFYWAPNTDWGVPPNPLLNDTTFPQKEWVYTSQIAQFNASDTYNFNIRGFNENNNSETVLYIDNFSVTEAFLRP